VIAALFRGSPQRGSADRALEGYDAVCDREELSLTSRLHYDLWSIFEAWNVIEAGLSPSLRVRYASPFLDLRVMQRLARLPDHQRIRDGASKYALRAAGASLYPSYLLENPKIGFTLDLREYLLDHSCAEILRRVYDDSSFGRRHLAREACQRMIDDTLSGDRNLGWQIWSLYLCSVAADALAP
jgi:asparagine synthase (glutamine-hydrolysing)